MAIAPDRTTELRPLSDQGLKRLSFQLNHSRLVRGALDFSGIGTFRMAGSIESGAESAYWSPKLLIYNPRTERLMLSQGLLEVSQGGDVLERIKPEDIRRVDSLHRSVVTSSGLVVEEFRPQEDSIGEDGIRLEVHPDYKGRKLMTIMFAFDPGKIEEGRDVVAVDPRPRVIMARSVIQAA